MKGEQVNGRWSQVLIPKVGWVRFRSTRDVGGQAVIARRVFVPAERARVSPATGPACYHHNTISQQQAWLALSNKADSLPGY